MLDNQNPDDLGASETAATIEQSMPLARVADLIKMSAEFVKHVDSKGIKPEEFRFMTSLLKGSADLAYPRHEGK